MYILLYEEVSWFVVQLAEEAEITIIARHWIISYYSGYECAAEGRERERAGVILMERKCTSNN